MDGQATIIESSELHKPIKTIPFLSKFERARVLGARALQISKGAPVNFDTGSETDPLKIAELELEKGLTPLTIRRWLPDGNYEDVSVRYFYKPDTE